MALRAACLLLAVVTSSAQTTLPLKAIIPTLVEIKVRLGIGIKDCSVAATVRAIC